MDPDLLLSLGLVLLVLAIPSMLAAVIDARPPYGSAITLFLSGALVLGAIYLKPGGYRLEDIPNAFFSAVAYLIS